MHKINALIWRNTMEWCAEHSHDRTEGTQKIHIGCNSVESLIRVMESLIKFGSSGSFSFAPFVKTVSVLKHSLFCCVVFHFLAKRSISSIMERFIGITCIWLRYIRALHRYHDTILFPLLSCVWWEITHTDTRSVVRVIVTSFFYSSFRLNWHNGNVIFMCTHTRRDKGHIDFICEAEKWQ